MGQGMPVDVISMCSTEGEIRPLRLRLRDEEEALVRVDVEQVVKIRQIPYVGMEAQIFLCRATVHGRPWMFELKYSFRSHVWAFLGKKY